LGEEITMAAPYKPGPQARFLVDKMAELEKSIQKVLTRLAPYLMQLSAWWTVLWQISGKFKRRWTWR
jgi:hypothetical protein